MLLSVPLPEINQSQFPQCNYAGKHVALPMPLGIAKTDAFFMFGKPIPAWLKAERGRAVDVITDAHQYLHGKKFALYG